MDKVFKYFLISVLFLLFLVALLFATMQTDWAQEKMKNKLISSLHEIGYEMTIEKIEAEPPLRWKLIGIYIKGKEQIISAESLTIRISPLSFLFHRAIISKMQGEDVSIFLQKKSDLNELRMTYRKNVTKISSPKIPIGIEIKRLYIPNLYVSDVVTGSNFSLDLHASFKINKSGAASCSLHLKDPTSSVDLYFKSIPLIDEAYLNINGDLSFFGSFTLNLKGPIATWKGILRKKHQPKPLKGTLDLNFIGTDTPYLSIPWHVDSTFSLWGNRSIDIAKLNATSSFGRFMMKGKLNSEYQITKAHLDYEIDDISLLSPKICGRLKGAIDYTPIQTTALLYQGWIKAPSFTIEKLKGNVELSNITEHWLGNLQFFGEAFDREWQATSGIDLFPFTELTLDDLSIGTNVMHTDGFLTIDIEKKRWLANFFAQIDDLSLFFKENITGSCVGTINLYGEDENLFSPHIEFHTLFNDINYKNTYAKTMHLNGDVIDWEGQISLEAEEVLFSKLSLSSLSFKTELDKEGNPFSLKGEGIWKEKIDFSLDGYLDKSLLTIENFNMAAFDQNFHLARPLTFEKHSKQWNLSNCEIFFDDGYFLAEATLDPSRVVAHTEGKNMPLEFFFLLYPNFSLDTTATFNGFIDATETTLRGHLSLLFDDVKNKGSVFLNLEDDHLQLQSQLIAKKNQLFDLNLTLPLLYQIDPIYFTIDLTKPLSGELLFHGKAEELFDFVNLGTHAFRGDISSHLFLSRTLNNPILQGFLDIQAGTYDNFYTGTHLENLYALFEAKKDHIEIITLDATDDKDGTLSGTGEISLNKDLTYTFNATLDNLKTLDTDTISSSFTGPLTFTGNKEKGLAQGSLDITAAEFHLAEDLPLEIPELPINYINKPEQHSSITPSKAYPLHLQLSLDVPGKFQLTGRGVDSEWSGHLNLTGINSNFTVNGKLELERGKLFFGGKHFTLIDGEITFIDYNDQRADINLLGTLDLPNLTITASLRGPLSSPKLTFQSIPQMPTSSLLAHILFNKDISEISPIQAIQLAETLVVLSGNTGSQLFEKIRRKIGIDQLTVVSSSKDDLSLKIGKYLIDGVLITLTQSYDTSQVSVELELGKGFIFQAETQDDQEGKFSLKWHYNY